MWSFTVLVGRLGQRWTKTALTYAAVARASSRPSRIFRKRGS
jgi:hypothetical protein